MYEKSRGDLRTNFRYLDNLAWLDFEAGQYRSVIQSYEILKADKISCRHMLK
jgi:hypothetical protein